jgi:hypothetical protein
LCEALFLIAILMHLFGWMIADPICSIFIAILIALSVSAHHMAQTQLQFHVGVDHVFFLFCGKLLVPAVVTFFEKKFTFDLLLDFF